MPVPCPPDDPPAAGTPAGAGGSAAEARGRAYSLLADLLLDGVTDATRAAAMASPILAEALSGATPTDTAVEHERAFGREVPPFESAFLEADGTLGGATAARVRASYAHFGFVPDPRGPEPDHLATELRALAFLAGAEQDALEDGRSDLVLRLRDLGRAFLDRHVLRWFFPFATAVRALELPFPSAWVTQVEELLLLHRRELAWPMAELARRSADGLDLAAPETGLAEIAAHLSRPARAGALLTRSDLAATARPHGIPRGFASREQMLLNLLRSAAHFDALEPVVADLGATLRARRDALAGLARREPWALTLVVPWMERLREAESLLEAIAEARPEVDAP
ncbi:MAG: molecular chaperone [Sandaracinaceae bacterium]